MCGKVDRLGGQVGHEDEMALGPPGRGGWEGKEPGEVPEGL